jgi:hypothetical protein
MSAGLYKINWAHVSAAPRSCFRSCCATLALVISVVTKPA